MSWQDQGRQEHGWFGNGTAAGHTDADDGRFIGSDGLGQRITAVAYSAIASLPRAVRAWAERQLDARSLSRLTEVMTAWSRGGKLDPASFAEHFFGRERTILSWRNFAALRRERPRE